jgi:putative hydroxymethylpyrimidine transporter CytX
MKNKQMGFWYFAFLWFGAAISIAEILTGNLLAPLGFSKGISAILIGHLIGTGILILGGWIGAEQKLSAIESTRISFGMAGSYLISTLNVIQLIGWTVVMIISGADALNAVTKSIWGLDQTNLWILLIGLFICGWIACGRQNWQHLNLIAGVLLLGVTGILSFSIFSNSASFTNTSTGVLNFGGAIELSVIMPLSWLPLIADYTRYGENKSKACLGSFTGYFLGSCWMYVIGLGSALAFPNQDLGSIMVAARLGMSAVGIILFSTITTTYLDVFSAGISLKNIFPKIDEGKVGITIGLVGTILAFYIPMIQYENFLYAIGSTFAPLFAILLSDYFILKKKAIEPSLMVDIRRVLIWFVGVILYYALLPHSSILGVTVPTMLITGGINLLTSKLSLKWTCAKNLS